MSGGALLARKKAFALGLLTRKFASAANGFSLFARTPLGRLLIGPPRLHFAKYAFALHLFLQDPEGLINIVVTYDDLQCFHLTRLDVSENVRHAPRRR
jgi:hypothetical protein